MSRFLFYLLLFAVLLFGGYETVVAPPTVTPSPDPAENIGVPLSAPFSLKWGHPGAVGATGMIVMFDRIIVDPRCPQATECNSDNPVAAAFTVYGPTGSPAHMVLTAHTDNQGVVQPASGDVVVSDSAHGFTFTLLKVTPYPETRDVIAAGDYEVYLRVDPAPQLAPLITAGLDTPFTLAPGNTMQLNDVGMLVSVADVTDHRCPLDLECGAIGKSAVEVSLIVLDVEGKTNRVKLAARTDYAGLVLPPTEEMQPQVTVGDYTLKLQRVAPYPVSSDEITGADYRVTMVVTRAHADIPTTPEATLAQTTALTATLGETFDLHLNDTALVAGEGLQLQFTGIQMDSRCPLDVMCVWSGVVGLEFVATAPDGATGRAVLGGYADQQGKVSPIMETGTAPLMSLEGYTITIERIQPYPAHHDQTIAPEEYVATLAVTKNE